MRDHSSTFVYYTELKLKSKKQGRPGNEPSNPYGLIFFSRPKMLNYFIFVFPSLECVGPAECRSQEVF